MAIVHLYSDHWNHKWWQTPHHNHNKSNNNNKPSSKQFDDAIQHTLIDYQCVSVNSSITILNLISEAFNQCVRSSFNGRTIVAIQKQQKQTREVSSGTVNMRINWHVNHGRGVEGIGRVKISGHNVCLCLFGINHVASVTCTIQNDATQQKNATTAHKIPWFPPHTHLHILNCIRIASTIELLAQIESSCRLDYHIHFGIVCIRRIFRPVNVSKHKQPTIRNRTDRMINTRRAWGFVKTIRYKLRAEWQVVWFISWAIHKYTHIFTGPKCVRHCKWLNHRHRRCQNKNCVCRLIHTFWASDSQLKLQSRISSDLHFMCELLAARAGCMPKTIDNVEAVNAYGMACVGFGGVKKPSTRANTTTIFEYSIWILCENCGLVYVAWCWADINTKVHFLVTDATLLRQINAIFLHQLWMVCVVCTVVTSYVFRQNAKKLFISYCVLLHLDGKPLYIYRVCNGINITKLPINNERRL